MKQGENTWLTKGFDMVDALQIGAKKINSFNLRPSCRTRWTGFDQGISDYDHPSRHYGKAMKTTKMPFKQNATKMKSGLGAMIF